MRLRVISRFFILLLLSTSALAQSPNGTVSGLILDPAGRTISGATVLIVNDLTGIQYQGKSSGDGIYAITNLPPGPYRIQMSKVGFKTIIKPDLVLNVQDALAVNFTLPVGAASETLTVEGGALLVETESAAVSTVIDRQFAENLPLNGRSFQSLIDLTPGVVVTASTNQDGGQFSVNGQRPSSNLWMVDGVSANIGVSTYFPPGNGFGGSLGAFSAQGGTNSLVSVDAMQEFRIQTSTYAPEFGRAPGGQISIVTRSGSKEWHGTAFDYLRNDALDANDWFADHAGLAKAKERQNDFGGTFSGPLTPNRTFFFFSYEGLRLRLPETALDTVPDLPSRQTAAPAMRPFLNAFPMPNGQDLGGGIATFNSSYSNSSTLDALSLRIDRTLGDNRLTLFGRYNYSPSENVQRGGPGYSLSHVAPSRINTQTGTAGATWKLSERIVNDFRFNYSRTDAQSLNSVDSFGGAVPFPSLPVPPPYLEQNAQLFLDIFSLTGGYLVVGANLSNTLNQINFVDNLSLERGAHSWKLGADFRRLSTRYGPYLYGQSAFFADVPSATLGALNFSQVGADAATTIGFHNLSLFAQDTWHASPRSTLTYGLRWDVDFAPSAADGPNFPAVSGYHLNDLSDLKLAPAGRPPFATPFGGVAPRLGIAYQLFRYDKYPAVARGGFGMFFDLASQEAGNVIGQDAYPFEATTFANGGTFPLEGTAAAAPSIVAPGDGSGTLLAFDPHLKLPYSLEWNAAIEQGLGKEQALTLSYVGAAGRRLLQTTDLLSPNQNYAAAILVGNTAYSQYDALQVQFQRRLSGGLQALASYTWSHSIDNASASSLGNAANGSNPAVDPSANRGPSDFDIRNAFSAAATYELPSPQHGALMKIILAGWSLENVLQVRGATPVSLYDSAFLYLNNGYTSVRPDKVAGQSQYLYGASFPGGKAFNPAAFAAPPVDASGDPLRQGNLARNALRGFGAAQWDFAVHREFSLHHGLHLQFRAEMFNLLNHPNFGPLVGDLKSPQFGQSIQMLGESLGGSNLGGGGFSPLYQLGGPRSIQVALKLVF